MKYHEALILGVIAVIVALLVQVGFVVLGAYVGIDVIDFSYTMGGATLIVSLFAAAFIEELARVVLLYAYMRQRSFPSSWWPYALIFGIGFGGTELLLGVFSVADERVFIPYLGIFFLHVILSLCAGALAHHLRTRGVVLALIMLTILHVGYNAIALSGISG